MVLFHKMRWFDNLKLAGELRRGYFNARRGGLSIRMHLRKKTVAPKQMPTVANDTQKRMVNISPRYTIPAKIKSIILVPPSIGCTIREYSNKSAKIAGRSNQHYK
jgi:hypothetical protein